jgi:hypothetical protein
MSEFIHCGSDTPKLVGDREPVEPTSALWSGDVPVAGLGALARVGRRGRRPSNAPELALGLFTFAIKAVSKLADEHRAQLHNYLKAAGCRVGLLVNFGHFPLVEHERIVR